MQSIEGKHTCTLTTYLHCKNEEQKKRKKAVMMVNKMDDKETSHKANNCKARARSKLVIPKAMNLNGGIKSFLRIAQAEDK